MTPTPDVAPRDAAPVPSLGFLAQGYRFGANRFRRYRSDVVQTRLAAEKTTLIAGEEAAEVLYDTAKFQRDGAMPLPVRQTLLGVGGVQGLDGEQHRSRKAMLLSFMNADRSPEVARLFALQWRAALPAWSRAGSIVLLDESAKLLCRAVCEWSGVPLAEDEVDVRTADLRSLIEDVGDFRPWNIGYFRARAARTRAEAWGSSLIERTRSGELTPPADSPLAVVAAYREDGQLLETRIAAVDLLNVLRPTVAIHRWIALAGLALELHPRWKEELRDSDDDVEAFVHEVRRYYPFFPMVAGKVRQAFEWRGVRFPVGRRVMLDITATDHDPRTFDAPEEFRPERFHDWDGSAFSFVPQGGGDHATGHRCSGEWITIDVMAAAVRLLTRETAYEAPAQDLRVSWRRMPTAPRSGLVMSGVRAA